MTALALDPDPYGGVPIAEVGTRPGVLVSRPGQLQYGQALLGVGTAAGWRELVGWRDLPDAAVADTLRPQGPGAYPGDVLGGSLVATFTYLVRGTPAAKQDAVDALELFMPMDGVDRPLVVNDGSGPWLRQARVIARTVPQDKHYTHAPLECSVQFLCADPRRYSLAEHTLTLVRASTVGGLVYPLVYPNEYGTFIPGGGLATNAGNAATPLVATFRGPVDQPTLSTRDWQLAFDIQLAAGESLVVDTGDGTALLNGTTDRLYTITNRSDPVEACLLPPGNTQLDLTAVSGQGSLTVTYRDARM